MARRTFSFDRDYYDRFYRNAKTRVATRKEIRKLADFVCAYLRHLDLPVRKALDLGCGLGYWQAEILRHFPRVEYQGVELSDYLCRKHGWTQGSVVDFRPRQKADLVICQGVLQYLTEAVARRAIRNLASLTRAALYCEVLTIQDWEENCDQAVTDGEVHLREGSWYRRQLGRYFINCGGGLFLAKGSPATLFELERLELDQD